MTIENGLFDEPQDKEDAVKTAQIILSEPSLIREYFLSCDATFPETDSGLGNNSEN